MTDSVLVLRELDEDFYNCIPNVRNGYEIMFPESEFKGDILVNKIIPHKGEKSSKVALFYSGELDSVQTLISHLDEKPDLIAIWGSDIKYDNEEGWKLVYSAVEETAEKFGLKDVSIHSSFREFDCEGTLHREFAAQLKDGWWHGVKHGIGLLGHVAPYAYIYNLSVMYIASSNCPADGVVRCASNPLIDNNVCFTGCQVVHDGFEYSRQDKVHNLVKYCEANDTEIKLHVCWETQTGTNCCQCEKCYRTIAGLIAEMADPNTYGFEVVDCEDMQKRIILSDSFNSNVSISYWKHIHDTMCVNKKELMKSHYWKDIKWILKADFEHPKTIKVPLKYRLQQNIYKNPLYQLAHRFKVIIKNEKR